MSDERVHQVSFDSLFEKTRGLLYLEPPPPQIVQTMKVEDERVYHGLVLTVTDPEGGSRRIAILTDYQNLLKLGQQIVQALSPAP